MREKLKPCPFCGCKDVLEEDDGNYPEFSECWCECASCGATSMISRYYDSAIKAWNTRTEGNN